MQLLIYTGKLTPRIQYIFNFIFKDILKIEIDFTTSEDDFIAENGPKLCYSDAPVGASLFFRQTSLLLQTRIEPLKIKTAIFGDLKVPFPVEASALPFDVFAAAFYFISRHEEYLHNQDKNAPFSAAFSLQKKLNLLNKPVIDEWALLIKNLIVKKYPSLKAGDRSFSYIPTINTWLKPKQPAGMLNKGGHFINALFKKEGRKQLFDNLTGLGSNEDKILQFLNDNFRKHHLIPFYFIGFEWDTTAAENCRDYIEKIKTAANIGLLGPCPDADNHQLITSMIALLNEIPVNNAPMTQQLEGLTMPGCYLQLLKGGVTADFSMGYPEICGFRAGTCTPFSWYDLQLEKTTDLKVYPYAISDQALLNMRFSDAEKTAKQLIGRIKFVNGTFCSSWATKSLSENVKFKKWRTLYGSILNYAGN